MVEPEALGGGAGQLLGGERARLQQHRGGRLAVAARRRDRGLHLLALQEAKLDHHVRERAPGAAPPRGRRDAVGRHPAAGVGAVGRLVGRLEGAFGVSLPRTLAVRIVGLEGQVDGATVSRARASACSRAPTGESASARGMTANPSSSDAGRSLVVRSSAMRSRPPKASAPSCPCSRRAGPRTGRRSRGPPHPRRGPRRPGRAPRP